ncbi:MAG: glycosyltransferase [Planctomycetota bacterium]
MSAEHTVLHIFSTFAAAGPQVRTVGLMTALGPDWKHRVVAADGRLDALELVPEGIDATAGGSLGGVRSARRLLRDLRPALLCTYNWGSFDAVLAARSLGLCNHLHHEDGFNADEVPRRKRRRAWARRWALGKAHRVVVPSHVLEDIAQREWGLTPPRLVRVPNGVDTERFCPGNEGRDALRASLSIPADALVVGAVGHLRPVKRFEVLIRACGRLPRELTGAGVHLLILGDGAERTALEREAADHAPPGGRVHLPGHHADLAPWYRAMDVFALSSSSEQLPLSLLEAMAAGLPVVATDVGDLRVTLGPGLDGHLVGAEGDCEGALAAELEVLLRSANERQRLGAAGRERVREAFSEEAMVSAYRGLYEAAASS